MPNKTYSSKNFGGLTPEQLAVWDKKNDILKLKKESKTLESFIGIAIGWILGVFMTAALCAYYNECVYVEIYTADPPAVYRWNQITQEKGEEVK